MRAGILVFKMNCVMKYMYKYSIARLLHYHYHYHHDVTSNYIVHYWYDKITHRCLKQIEEMIHKINALKSSKRAST